MTPGASIPHFNSSLPMHSNASGSTTSTNASPPSTISQRPDLVGTCKNGVIVYTAVGPAPTHNAAHSALKAFCKLAFLRIPAGALSIVTCAGAQAVSFGCAAILCGGLSVGVGLLWPFALYNIDVTGPLYCKAVEGGAWLGYRMSEGAGSLMKYAAQNEAAGTSTEEISKKLAMVSSITGGVVTSVPIVTGIVLSSLALAIPACCCCHCH